MIYTVYMYNFLFYSSHISFTCCYLTLNLQSLKRLRAVFNDADERGISGARRFLNGPIFCFYRPRHLHFDY